MINSKESGFFKITIIILIALFGVMYFIKDEQGENYLNKTYSQIHYYFVERNQDAIEKAQNAKKLMQKHENELQKNLDQ